MASMPADGIWMIPSDALSPLGLTPKQSHPRTLANQTPTKASREGSEIQLVLKKVLGSTTSSARGFDCNPSTSSFAFCAGSAAVVAHVDAELNITQKFFRAQSSSTRFQHISSLSESSLAPQTPESNVRLTASLRRKTLGIRSIGSPRVEPGVSAGRANIRQRTRAASCVSLSPDGRLLAVGETGYNPRILIFSTAREPNVTPLACLADHTFGVRCLAFSPDSRWLCSFGEPNDGFVYLWAINPKNGSAKLHSSNKCISPVHDVVWMGSSILSVGTRHVKLWRPDQAAPPSPSKTKYRFDTEVTLPPSPGPRTLPGRNCILGPLIEATFTCVRAISETRAVMCAERGAICILDGGERTQRLYKVFNVDYGVRCLAVDLSMEQLWVAANGIDIRSFRFADLVQPQGVLSPHRSASSSTDSTVSSTDSSLGPVALGCIANNLVAIDGTHSIRVYSRVGEDVKWAEPSIANDARSHGCSVLGVGLLPMPNPQHSHFFTWSSDGTVLFWSKDGFNKGSMNVPLEQPQFDEDAELNELAVVRTSEDGSFFAAGDKSGVLRVSAKHEWAESSALKAHHGDINDIAVVRRSDETSFIASCSRDRTVQVFALRSSELSLTQTIDQHGSSVNQVLFQDGGSTLFSSSSDRTIITHTLVLAEDSMAYIPTRIITLKSTPLSMCTAWNDPTVLVVSTTDKQVYKYEVNTARQIHGIHLTDNENNESLLLDSIVTRTISLTGENLIMIGVSSTDKSLRVFDLESGTTIAKEYGHSEGISGVAVMKKDDEEDDSGYTLISTGLDGTVMLWDLSQTTISADQNVPTTPSKNTPTLSQPPLRRVISRSALSEYQRSLEANGIAALPLAPGRSSSPSRLRKKPSRISLATPAAPKLAPVTLPSTPCPPFPRRSHLSQSPALTSPITMERQRPQFTESNRANSAGNLNDLNSAAEQLCRSLRAFRKQLASSPEGLRADAARELERELANAVRAIGPPKHRRAMVGSQADVGDLLGDYSERLARMVEEKVNLGLSLRRGSDGVLARSGDLLEVKGGDGTGAERGVGDGEGEEMVRRGSA